MTLLTVNDLVMHFPLTGSRKLVQAVNGVSFTLEKGQTLSLVGESGSGKTTIGRCLLGLIQPTAGQIVFAGTRIGSRTSIRSPLLRGRMQLVFQEPAGISRVRVPGPVRIADSRRPEEFHQAPLPRALGVLPN